MPCMFGKPRIGCQRLSSEGRGSDSTTVRVAYMPSISVLKSPNFLAPPHPAASPTTAPLCDRHALRLPCIAAAIRCPAAALLHLEPCVAVRHPREASLDRGTQTTSLRPPPGSVSGTSATSVAFGRRTSCRHCIWWAMTLLASLVYAAQ